LLLLYGEKKESKTKLTEEGSSDQKVGDRFLTGEARLYMKIIYKYKARFWYVIICCPKNVVVVAESNTSFSKERGLLCVLKNGRWYRKVVRVM